MIEWSCACGNKLLLEAKSQTVSHGGQLLTTIFVVKCDKCGNVLSWGLTPLQVAKVGKS